MAPKPTQEEHPRKMKPRALIPTVTPRMSIPSDQLEMNLREVKSAICQPLALGESNCCSDIPTLEERVTSKYVRAQSRHG